MRKKILWFISLAVLIVPLLLVGCGGGGDGGTAISNISDNSGDSSSPRLVVDKDNGLHLVWFDLSTGTNQIMYAEKTPDSGWTEPLNLSNSFSNSRSPKMVVDNQGTTHVVWHEYADGKFRFFYSQKPKGGTWSEPYDVTSKREASTYPALALDSQGLVHLVWEEDKLKQDTELYYTDIYYSYRNTDGTWSEAVNISNNDGDSTYPSIVIDSQDNVHVVWEDDTPGIHQILYATQPKGGTWSEPVNISNTTVDSEDPIYPVMVVDSRDTIHAAWHDIGLGNWEILYCSKPKGDSWSQPVNVSRNISNSGVPSLAVDKRDNLYLAWNDDSSGNFDIFYLAKPRDGTWGQVVNISQTSEKSGDPSIAVDNVYHVHIAWSEYITE
jgi:hypothetical protein